jgi:hypothetical protein
MIDDKIQRLIEAAEAAEARLAQLEASKNKRPLTGPQPVDWREFAAMQKRLAQAEADRDVLAAEVEGWRYDVPCDTTDLVASDGTLTRLGELVKLTDASGALQRAKEAK